MLGPRTIFSQLQRKAHWRWRPSQRSGNSYVGIFASHAEAAGTIEGSAGFDSASGAGFYRERLDQVSPEDYPLLFWMQPIAPGLRDIFDFGGHIGLHYYAFRSRLALAADLTWTVSDVPEVMREGAQLAEERHASALRFEGGFAAANDAGLMLSSGALQFLEAGALVDALQACARKPRHLLLNKLPVHDGAGYVTVQDTGLFKVPYTIFSREALFGGLAALGYRLRDSWRNPGHHCLVWRRPELWVESFTGAYFELG